MNGEPWEYTHFPLYLATKKSDMHKNKQDCALNVMHSPLIPPVTIAKGESFRFVFLSVFVLMRSLAKRRP